MVIRRATAADARAILAVVQGAPDPPYYGDAQTALINMEEQLQAQPVMLDEATGFICWVYKDVRFERYAVPWLLPGEKPTAMTDLVWDLARGRLLKAALADAWTNATDAERQWQIEARFSRARNTLGVLDGGEEACKKWQAALVALRPTGTKPLVQRAATGEWVIFWTLDAAYKRMLLLPAA